MLRTCCFALLFTLLFTGISHAEDGWVSLFDGKTLNGWTQKNGTATYEVKDGTILGTTLTGSPNSFLCSDKEYGDFVLEFEVKVDDTLNSGVQIRSKTKTTDGEKKNDKFGRVFGPQVEIEAGPAEAGYVYGEATGRGWLTPKERLKPHAHFKNGEWNAFRVVAHGPRITTHINGHLIEDLVDEPIYETHPSGFIGLQVHGIGKRTDKLPVQWRNIRIKELESGPIPGIGPIGDVEKLHGDLKFTEGPTQAPDGTLYFTDIPADRIYKRTPEGKLTVLLEPAGHCNGLMATANGTLYACSMDGRLITVDTKTAEVTTLSDKYNDVRFNAPNDLVIDQLGGVYFTDPHFRAPDPLPQGKTAVYYRAADGTVSRLVDDLKAPNGVILSPDEKTLYVIPSMQAEMWAYPVTSPGKLGEGKVLCTLKQADGETGRGGDGLTIDTYGNLYITSGLGLQVVSPNGKLLGIIAFPEKPANVAFGGADHRTLFVTARTSLYSVSTYAKGHVFPGPKQGE